MHGRPVRRSVGPDWSGPVRGPDFRSEILFGPVRGPDFGPDFRYGPVVHEDEFLIHDLKDLSILL